MRPPGAHRGPARFAFILIATGALAACASGPRAPDWRVNAVGHVERFTQAYLSGDARVAAREFDLARADVARTGRPALVARVELNRCAVQVASLDFAPCTGFDALAADAEPTERAYARYLAGQARAADAPLLPAPHRAAVAQAGAVDAAGGVDAGDAGDAAGALARLINAGVRLRQGRASPSLVAQAVDAASHQGWRRPLLAWLGVQARLADERGDAAEAARLRRRMDLVEPAAPAR